MSVNRWLAFAAGGLATLALVAGDTLAPGGPGEIAALDVAVALRADPDAVRILDVRTADAYEDFHLPRSRHAPFTPGSSDEWVSAVSAGGVARDESVVIAGGPEVDARAPWLALRKAGFSDVRYMRDAVAEWVDTIVSPVLRAGSDAAAREEFDRRAEVARYFGGFPRVLAAGDPELGGTAERLRKARRRGCAF